MENLTNKSMSVKFSAYTQVCQKFLEACEEAEVDPQDALQSIWRFLSPETLPVAVSAPKSTTSQTASLAGPVDPNKVQLSKAQVEEAKREARIAKAKKLGVSLAEINLTSTEAKEAKAAMRKRVASGTQPQPVLQEKGASPGKSASQSNGKKSSGRTKTESSKSEIDLTTPVGIRNQAPQTGSRATAKTRLDNFRRNALRSIPSSVVDPTTLHLVAYSNHYNRLARQWDEFKNTYGSSGLQNPLRDLPNPVALKLTNALLQQVGVRLKEQSDSPGTYVLQTEKGGSFWDRDKPDIVNCPDFLLEPIPKDVLDEIEIASGACN